jgi:hypothetical protein
MKINYLLFKEFEVEKAIEDIQNNLNSNIENFKVKQNNFKDYDIIAKSSVGIGMSIQNNFSLPIKTNLKLIKIDSLNTNIILSTSLRIELIVIMLLWCIVIVIQIFGREHIPIWVTLFLFPLILLWFGSIYRMQEEALQIRIEEHLKSI